MKNFYALVWTNDCGEYLRPIPPMDRLSGAVGGGADPDPGVMVYEDLATANAMAAEQQELWGGDDMCQFAAVVPMRALEEAERGDWLIGLQAVMPGKANSHFYAGYLLLDEEGVCR